MLKKCLWLLLIACMAAQVCSAERRKPVILEGKKVLPLRVLARPFSHIYNDKDINSGTVKENVPAFQPYYVYTRPDAVDLELQQGWYEIGADNRGNVLGWMQAGDVFEWKQTMCLAYTHPEGRKPVLMFAQRKPLADISQKTSDIRLKEVEKLYSAIESRQISNDFPVRSIEPKQAVDISSQFYLLPILSFEELEIEGREGRLVQLAAATAAGPDARESADIRLNRAYLDEAGRTAGEVNTDVLKNMKMDVVFVTDTTVSMRPYIKATLDVIRQVAQELGSDPATAGSLRFGVWGYRDPVDKIPGIGYTTFNYTPKLLPVNEFVNVLSQVEVTRIDSDDYAEDVFSGINDAVFQTPWSEDAIRIIVLLGDAPGHEIGHKYNASGQSIQTLRTVSNDLSIYLCAMHVKAPRAKKYHEPAEIQFKALSANPGMQDGSAYYSISSEDIQGFKQAAGDITYVLTTMLKSAKQGTVGKNLDNGSNSDMIVKENPSVTTGISEEAALSEPAVNSSGIKSETGSMSDSKTSTADIPKENAAPGTELDERGPAYQMVKAAMVDWIGKQTGAKAPRDIVAWATDKDLLTPDIQAMEVRFLINKRQLDSLHTILKEVMAAGRRGQIGGEDFFSALQATSAAASRDPNLIKNARTMADTGLIPEFLSGLPYRSNLMSMNNDLWMSWSVDEQDEFLNELEAKMQAYECIHNRPEGWVALNPEDDPDEHVYPVSLELLP